MPVPITCSGCAAKMTAPDTFIGKRATCPKCKTSFVVPDPNVVEQFEVVEDEPLTATEIIDDESPPPAEPKKRSRSVVLQKNLRSKKKVDASDYLTKVNGKPIALRPGEAAPPPIPRKSTPRE